MLKNKVVLVTGASRGIGLAIYKLFHEKGAIVVGTATSKKSVSTINDIGLSLIMDITDDNSIYEALKKMKNKVGMPEILVNNAGITEDRLFMRLNNNQWDKVIDTNLSGMFRIIRSCIRPMIKAKWGRIINISSIVAFTGNLGQANYAAAKSGIIGMSKSIAQEVASRGITVNIIAPGFINTDMTKKLTEKQKTQMLDKIPMQRMGSVCEIAHAVEFLASDVSSYITGETIHINGGMLMN